LIFPNRTRDAENGNHDSSTVFSDKYDAGLLHWDGLTCYLPIYKYWQPFTAGPFAQAGTRH
jgi:hypothetical protein